MVSGAGRPAPGAGSSFIGVSVNVYGGFHKWGYPKMDGL